MALTQDQKLQICRFNARCLTLFSEGIIYRWKPNAVYSDVKDTFDKLIEFYKSLNINFNDLTPEDLELIGCSRSHDPRRFNVPLHLLQVIPYGTVLYNEIKGMHIMGPDFPKESDHRSGMTMWTLTAVDNACVDSASG